MYLLYNTGLKESVDNSNAQRHILKKSYFGLIRGDNFQLRNNLFIIFLCGLDLASGGGRHQNFK